MKGRKFGITALLLSSITFAAPVSTPNQMSDTPIISGGGTANGGTCRAYQTNGTAILLSGGETLVFYGGGSNGGSAGGYLSTKTTYSGTAYVRTSGRDGGCYCVRYYEGSCQEVSCLSGSGIGLFASSTDASQNSFIAGAGAGIRNRHGGGWYGDGGGNIYRGTWFGEELVPRAIQYCWEHCRRWRIGFKITWGCDIRCSTSGYGYDSGGGVGFHGGNRTMGAGGGASSISAYYNSPLRIREATTLWNTLTVAGGGQYGAGKPTLYVCQ
jgi:hypothetical protein